MINPNHELFRWGPIPGKPLYVSYFMVAIAELLPKHYRFRWPDIAFYFIGDKMTFICDYQELRECGENHFNTWIMDDQEFAKVKADYDKKLEELHQISAQVKNLNSLSDQELQTLYKSWQDAYLQWWAPALVPELANWGGEKILKEKLLHLAPSNFIRAFEKLSAPIYLSFYQEEELDLLKNPTQLEKHASKYFWITNSYHDVVIRGQDYFQTRLKEFAGKDLKFEIEKIRELPRKAKTEKEEIITEFGLSKEIQKISERLSYCIYWQDQRKKEIFIANHYIHLFASEIAKRKKCPVLDLEYYWCSELEKSRVSNEEIALRQKKCVGYYTDKLEFVFNHQNFDAIVKPLMEKKVDPNLKELKGTVASMGRGVVRGKVRILLHPKEWAKMQQGDILVAPMTSPEYIFAMKKAAAIITDEGGMTSHAAIVSRELKLPCIVGTQIATKLFKDGEEVEVDTNKGIVKKITQK